MSSEEPEPEPEADSRRRALTPTPLFDPGERLPWLLRQPVRDATLRPEDREADRAAALEARKFALIVIPAVGLGWLLVALIGSEDALRITTIATLVVCIVVGVRAATTTQRFRRRWMDPAAVLAPPIWLTLATVGASVAAVVAIANFASDLQADRSTVRATVIAVIALAVVAAGAFAHLTGGRSAAAALRGPPE